MVDSSATSSFQTLVDKEIIKNLPNWYGLENWDTELLPYKSLYGERLFVLVQDFFKKAFKRRLFDYQYIEKTYSRLYELLNDKYSRALLIKVIAHRIMGYRKVKLPLNNTNYWSDRKFVSTLIKGNENIRPDFRNFTLHLFELNKIGYPIELFINPSSVVATFILKQYEYQKTAIPIKAKSGDYVIDAGGCWGDTALYFANEVGPQGKVYTFEFTPNNLKILKKNISLNPKYSNLIDTNCNALWSKSNQYIGYSSEGPATSLKDNRQDISKVITVSLDDFVKKRKIVKIDFIKMDIEGSELEALRGSIRTIQKFRPTLAISIYHNDIDFLEIPSFIEELNLGYKFYIDHFSIYRGETILFAVT